MDKTLIQNLADKRIEEAEILRDNTMYSGAYYLAGYSIELALKACIYKKIETTDGLGIIFSGKNFINKCHTHDLVVLLKLAGLKPDLDRRSVYVQFGANWRIVSSWSETSRYEQHSESDANELIDAVTDTSEGILPWLKTYW